MKPVQRSELLDYVTYGEQRERIRASALGAKSIRRVLVGEYFTFLFENHETVRYQIQEMMRIERMVKEDDIQHELDTYNELLHPRGSIGCTLLVGIDDEAERDEKLRAWMGLNEHIYAELPGDAGIPAKWGIRACPPSSISRSSLATRLRSPSGSPCPGSRRKPSFPKRSGRRSASISGRNESFRAE